MHLSTVLAQRHEEEQKALRERYLALAVWDEDFAGDWHRLNVRASEETEDPEKEEEGEKRRDKKGSRGIGKERRKGRRRCKKMEEM